MVIAFLEWRLFIGVQEKLWLHQREYLGISPRRPGSPFFLLWVMALMLGLLALTALNVSYELR